MDQRQSVVHKVGCYEPESPWESMCADCQATRELADAMAQQWEAERTNLPIHEEII